jgi:aminoglycoside phosphotransferase (APT) family kinase protein
MIPDSTGHFCFIISGLIITLFDYIEGFHPSYSLNQLSAAKLASLFFKLHSIPIIEFPSFEQEHFNIEYALGLRRWINNDIEIKDKTHAKVMLSKLENNKDQLLNGLTKLKQWTEQFSQLNMPYFITHGDPHHYNVLQTPLDVWLVDWDGIKRAPIERDLWHYQNAPLMNAYYKINPQLKINDELCEFYRMQRFFEDCSYYLEQVLLRKNTTTMQADEDKNSLLSHGGWSICLK